jgi:hypothetical protein
VPFLAGPRPACRMACFVPAVSKPFCTTGAKATPRWCGEAASPVAQRLDRAMAPSSPSHGSIQARAGPAYGQSSRRASALPRHHKTRRPPARRTSFNIRIPDLGVTREPRDPDAKLLEEPVILIEILSPTNESDTWGRLMSQSGHLEFSSMFRGLSAPKVQRPFYVVPSTQSPDAHPSCLKNAG